MEAQSTHAQLDLVYHGTNVVSGSMEVRDLAPAMLAMAALFEAAALEANGERAKININLKSTSTNSFHLGLEIYNTIGNQSVMDSLRTASELKEIIFGTGTVGLLGVWSLISKLKRRKPETVERDGDIVRITVNGDNKVSNISINVYNLYGEFKVRKAVEDIANIVKSEGIDVIEIRDGNKVIQRIDKNNVDDFDYNHPDDVLTDNTVSKVFTLVNISFKENNKWRVSDGETTYIASIDDTDFLTQINNNEISFSKGGLLKCQFQTIQRSTPAGIKSEYRITKVERYIPSSQLSLPIQD